MKFQFVIHMERMDASGGMPAAAEAMREHLVFGAAGRLLDLFIREVMPAFA